jgi:hypothetical protein
MFNLEVCITIILNCEKRFFVGRHHLPLVRPLHGLPGGPETSEARGVQERRRLPLQAEGHAKLRLQVQRPDRRGCRRRSRNHPTRNTDLRSLKRCKTPLF